MNPLDALDRSKILLPWVYLKDNKTIELFVPVKVQPFKALPDATAERQAALYETKWHVWFQQRPYYCDRGRWHCVVNGVCVEGPDDHEGFPRYYFSLQRGLEEMEEWIRIRKEIQDAVKP